MVNTILFEEDTKVEGRPVVIKNEGAFSDINNSGIDGRRQSLQYATLALDQEIFDKEGGGGDKGAGGVGKTKAKYAENQKGLKDNRLSLITRMERQKITYITTLKEHSLFLFLPSDSTELDTCQTANFNFVVFDKQQYAKNANTFLLNNWTEATTTLKALFPSLTIGRPWTAARYGSKDDIEMAKSGVIYCPLVPSATMIKAVGSTKNTNPLELACLRTGIYSEVEGLGFPLIQYRAVGTQSAGAYASEPLKYGVMTTNFGLKLDADKKLLVPNKVDIVEWVEKLLRDKIFAP